jgi:MFS family permease
MNRHTPSGGNSPASTPARNRIAAWRMVMLGFLAQNCAGGMVMGSFGTVLTILQGELNVSRAAVSSTLGVIYMSLCLSSPIVGGLLQHYKLRTMMIVGSLGAAIASLLLAYAQSFTTVVLLCALLLGPSMCMVGIIPTSTLVSRWFTHDRGKALGIANMPLFLLVVPPIAAKIAISHGRTGVFLAMTGVFLLLILLLSRILERPDAADRRFPSDQGLATDRRSGTSGSEMSSAALLHDSRFWLLSLGIGIMAGGGTIFLGHAVPMAQQKGFALTTASMLMSSCGAGALLGALTFGWLIDRIGALSSLTLNASIQALTWLGFFFASSLWALLLLSLLTGICYGAQIALHGAALNEFFGTTNISKAMGLSYLLKVPFLFASAPIAGYIFDVSGNYDGAVIMCAIALTFSTLLFGWLKIRGQRQIPHIPVAVQ